MKISTISLSDILPETTYQMRKTSLGKNVPELIRLIADGIELDPITLWETPRGYVILDGFQRIEATLKANGEQGTIRAYVKRMHENSTKVALEIAIAANLKHGAPLERADRKEMAIRLLKEDPRMADTQIAKSTGWSARTIANYRSEVEGAQSDTRVDVNGREMKVRQPEKGKAAAVVDEATVKFIPEELLEHKITGSKSDESVIVNLKDLGGDILNTSPAAIFPTNAKMEADHRQVVESYQVRIDPVLSVLSGQLADVDENLQSMASFIEMQLKKQEEERTEDETEQLAAIKEAVSNLLFWQSKSFDFDE